MMNRKRFDWLVMKKLEKIKQLLIIKGAEYQRNEDVLHNFNRAATISCKTREEAIWGMANKHLVSFLDIIDDVGKGQLPSEELLEEKTSDLINYIILTEASIKEKYGNKKQRFN